MAEPEDKGEKYDLHRDTVSAGYGRAVGGKTLGDLTQFADDLRAALRLANEDKKALRDWLADGSEK